MIKPSHKFIFTPGQWVGEGRITFSISPDRFRFYTKWTIEKNAKGIITCQQQVEMEGREESLVNTLTLTNIKPEGFDIELDNGILGLIPGKGVIDPHTIAWEFRGHPDFEGFEVYELQEDGGGDYMLHAEYSSVENFRTIIDGRIWCKDEKKEKG